MSRWGKARRDVSQSIPDHIDTYRARSEFLELRTHARRLTDENERLRHDLTDAANALASGEAQEATDGAPAAGGGCTEASRGSAGAVSAAASSSAATVSFSFVPSRAEEEEGGEEEKAGRSDGSI